jgi:hypothetical protein
VSTAAVQSCESAAGDMSKYAYRKLGKTALTIAKPDRYNDGEIGSKGYVWPDTAQN